MLFDACIYMGTGRDSIQTTHILHGCRTERVNPAAASQFTVTSLIGLIKYHVTPSV